SYPFYRRPTVVGFNNQYGFAVFGNYIFAIGQTTKANSTLPSKGTLLKVNIANGTVNNTVSGASCYQNLNFAVSNYNVTLPLMPTFPTLVFKQKVSLKQVAIYDLGSSFICGGCSMTVNAGPDVTTCCAGNGVQLNATVTSGLAPFTYSWSPATGLNNPNIANPIATQPGTYTVTVTDASGCTASDVVVITQGGINCCRIAGKKATTYPNPFADNFNITIPQGKYATVFISNLYGTILEKRSNVSGTIQMGNRLQQGSYTITVIYKDGSKEEIKTIKASN
ncbi:MAG: T9SS type A sorting domain-containing protein, partial [Panacibacter sp.]